MFSYKTINQQFTEERKKREFSESKLNKARADVDYIAMMCDVELEFETEGNTDE